ncbi:PP2C family protein-serine/threonine phosphatase [Streptomyces sp. NPDC048389]|uniref:PP2C family protein-serine/threonine phosphatase n=1 Tax=Streptomyces sp. NPDC048389 TaxID=3154622 RepID=UPI003453B180
MVGRALPGVLLVLAAVLDVATPDTEHYEHFLFAVPALAAVTWGVFSTLGFGLLAVALFVVLATRREALASGDTGLSFLALAVVVAAAVWASRARIRREQELRDVAELADVTQRAVQRPLPSRLGPVDLHLLYEASAHGAHVGGDFCKALPVGGGVRLILGDVQGKGLGAVEAASMLLGSFRESAYAEPGLPEIARRLELSMRRYAQRAPEAEGADRFATVILAEIPDDAPVIRLLSLGHPPPLIQHDSTVRTVDFPTPSIPVNLPVLLEQEYDVRELPFESGDRMLLFTDGVSETRDRKGDFYPLEERFRQWAGRPADEIVSLLKQDLLHFGFHGIEDDTAALLVVRH